VGAAVGAGRRRQQVPSAAVDLRLATPDDAEAIRQIYNREVLGSTVVFDLRPRTIEEQRAWQDDRSGAHAVVVAIDDGDLVGFGSLSAYRDRPAYRTTVEDSVYVHPDHQGRGVGRAVLGELVEVAKARGFHTVIARIVGHNEASIAVHERLGFEPVGVEREVGRKFHQWLDVVVMQRLLGDAGVERPT
jgi:phosphinothricin acetyltransferase